MFALKSEKKLELIENKNLTTQSVTDKILSIYKKLKKIAKHEVTSRDRFKVAKLNHEQLNQLKSIELNIGFHLVAYEENDKFSDQKIQILTQINQLLNNYFKLITQDKEKNNLSDDFSKFFD